jgi:hypothetical protein
MALGSSNDGLLLSTGEASEPEAVASRATSRGVYIMRTRDATNGNEGYYATSKESARLERETRPAPDNAKKGCWERVSETFGVLEEDKRQQHPWELSTAILK